MLPEDGSTTTRSPEAMLSLEPAAATDASETLLFTRNAPSASCVETNLQESNLCRPAPGAPGTTCVMPSAEGAVSTFAKVPCSAVCFRTDAEFPGTTETS